MIKLNKVQSEQLTLCKKLRKDNLTKNQVIILQGIYDGLATREIAIQLNIPFRTIESRIYAMKKKTEIYSMQLLVRYAVRKKYIK